MKRVFLFAFPIIATFVAVGLGLLFLRTRVLSFSPRFAAAREAISQAVAEEIQEALE